MENKLASFEINAKAFLFQVLGKIALFFLAISIIFLLLELVFAPLKPNFLFEFLQLVLQILSIFLTALFLQKVSFLISRKFIILPEIERISSNFKGEKITSSTCFYRPFAFFSEKMPIPAFRVYGGRTELLVFFKKFHESVSNGFFEIFSLQSSFSIADKNFAYVLGQKSLRDKISRYLGKGYTELPELDHSGFYEIVSETHFVSTAFCIFSNEKHAGEELTEKILSKVIEIEKKNPHFLNLIFIRDGIASIEADVSDLTNEKIQALIDVSKILSEALENPVEITENEPNPKESIESSPTLNENPTS